MSAGDHSIVDMNDMTMTDEDSVMVTVVDETGLFDDGPDFDVDLAELPVRHPTAEQVLGFAFDDAECSQLMVNRQAARQLLAIGEAFEIARANPRIYVPVGAADRTPGIDDLDFAERSVAFDLAHRLNLSENLVRSLAHQAETLTASLPRLRDLFVEGSISAQRVRAAVESVDGVPDAVVGRYDERLSRVAASLRAGVFARRCRILRERLCADTLQERHDVARQRRRVCFEPAEDGMAWVSAFIPAVDVARIEARLTGVAARLRRVDGETRNRDQLRADLLVEWLAGDGTPSAATAQPHILIDGDGRFAELLGYGPIDPVSAARALRKAPSFRRVFDDPVTPTRLVLDSGQYRPSAEQRHWLRLNYGFDESAAPYLSLGSEVDHVVEWQHGGTTDVTNLVPLKPRLHRLKSVTRIRLDPKPDGGIRVRTPTGYDSDPPPF
ncbi:DUF222 domain-containing protein [Humibacter ginsenosidimutans]|uniref:DUF222 domain-containing protein n=2 Tax=Humibacter ginsenosidimutans TaxID=2599293 RepID=A0A5B8M1L0_9MICO|nr:DUF222 domain-containing protein [Humibacter ginsenosidimutans]